MVTIAGVSRCSGLAVTFYAPCYMHAGQIYLGIFCSTAKARITINPNPTGESTIYLVVQVSKLFGSTVLGTGSLARHKERRRVGRYTRTQTKRRQM